MTILISLFKAFKYRRYLVTFNNNNKLYSYIRGRAYYKLAIIFEAIAIIVAMTIKSFLLATRIVTSLSTYRASSPLIFKAISSSLSVYRASSSVSLYNLGSYLIV